MSPVHKLLAASALAANAALLAMLGATGYVIGTRALDVAPDWLGWLA